MENPEDIEKNIYIHKKSGKTYTKLGSASEQVDGVWHKTKIVYKNGDGDLFIRDLNEWQEKFLQITSTKEETDDEDCLNENMSNCCCATITEHSRRCPRCMKYL